MINEDGSSFPTIQDIDHYNEIIKCPGSDVESCEWTGTIEEWQYHHIETGHA